MSKINKIKVGATTYDVGGASGGYATCSMDSTTVWSGTAPDIQTTITSGTGDWANLTANDHPVLDIIITSSSTIEAEQEVWSKFWKAETGTASITFHVNEDISTYLSSNSITIAVKW